MLQIILVIGLIAAVLTIVIVLIQNPKGGGLAANFSSSNQIFGVQRTSEGVEKLTWTFGAVILIVSLFASSYNGTSKKATGASSSDPKMEEIMNQKAPKSNVTPQPAPNQAPSPDPTR